MRHKTWAVATYGLSILFLLLLLFFQEPEARLAAAFLLIADQATLLWGLARERWDWSHYLGLAYVVLAGAFALIAVAVPATGVTYLYGAVLILAALVLIVIEIAAGWRRYAVLDRLVQEPAERQVEEVLPPARQPYRLLAKQGSTTYHREDCRTLAQTKVASLIQLTQEEAKAFGMDPCKVCRP